MYISLYQIFLKYTVYEIFTGQTALERYGLGKQFLKKERKLKKMSGILRQWQLSLHRKTAKLLNMAPIFTILKIFEI